MNPLFTKFTQDLNLPRSVVESLQIPRTNEELRVFALSIPDILVPDTYNLAGRLFIYLHTITSPRTIANYVKVLDRILRPEIKDFLMANEGVLDELLDETYFYNFKNYTLISASKIVDYLLRTSKQDPPVETPCQMMLRLAVQFYYDEGVERVIRCYKELINQEYVHASPTMFNAGTRKNQMSSCFCKGTPIVTENRGLVSIEKVEIGDIVFTHRGNKKRVTQIHKNLRNGREIIGLQTIHSNYVKVTHDHRFWVSPGEWKEAGEIKFGDEILTLNPEHPEMVFSKIHRITLDVDNKDEFVYTLGVEDDHSYPAGGMMAENCFLLHLGDNLEDLLYTGAGDVGMISKLQGGIGMSMNGIRHSSISNTGKSSGVLPPGRIYDDTIRYVDQGGKRNGAATLSLKDWHLDIEDFVQARDNYTQNGIRFKQANTAIFVSRLFMERVRKDEKWTLMCPAKAELDGESLVNLNGDRFEKLYRRLEREVVIREADFDAVNRQVHELEKIVNSGDATEEDIMRLHELNTRRSLVRKNLIDYKVINARKFYHLICNMQVKSSFPYMVGADTMNVKNNTMNIGPTQSSNLCVAPETLILTDQGNIQISTLVDQNVFVWNGKKYSEVTVRKTGSNQELIKIVMGDEKYLECTRYHKFYLSDGKEVRAHELVSGSRLLKVEFPDSMSQGDTYVKEVQITGRISDTYCFNEPERHMGVFNGIPAGNCLEISLPATPDTIASCNLGHIPLKTFVDPKSKTYDFKGLGKAARAQVDNIDKVIDFNYYPLDKRDKDGNVIEKGKIHVPNIENRPLGIGVSGLGNVYEFMGYAYDSPEAELLNKKIFACMYFNAVYQSHLRAKEYGEYKTFRTGKSRIFKDGKFIEMDGSPMSNGYFQFDLWKADADYLESEGRLNEEIYRRADDEPIDPEEWGNDLPVKSWEELRELAKSGMRNSMLLAPMPTASSAQMVDSMETTECNQTLLYSRKLAHGNYICFSRKFLDDMLELKILNKKMIDFINSENGSIQNIHFFITDNPDFFPDLPWSEEKKLPVDYLKKIMNLRKVYKGMFEINPICTARQARQRGIYVDQSQSLNVYIPEPNEDILKAYHNMCDQLGLKTWMYYCRANPASQTGRFTVSLDVKKYKSTLADRKKNFVCAETECVMCE